MKSKKKLADGSLESQSLNSLFEEQRILREKKIEVREKFEVWQEKLAACTERIRVNKHVQDEIVKARGYLSLFSKNDKADLIEDEQKEFEQQQKLCRKEISSIDESYDMCKQKIKKYEDAIQKKLLKKEKLNILRDFYGGNYLEILFKDTPLSDEIYSYYQELLQINHKEFFKIVKKFYKKNDELDAQKIQNIFNAWFIYMLEREHAPYRRKLEENSKVIQQVEAATIKSQHDLEEYKEKNINEVWSSYDFKTKIAAWCYFFYKRRFPIYCDQQQLMVKSQNSLYAECVKDNALLQSEGPFKFIAPTAMNKNLQDQKKEQRVWYNLIKLLLQDNERAVPYISESNISVPVTTRNSGKKMQDAITFNHVEVKRQNNAECGYHALYNALNSVNKITINLESFLKNCKKKIKKKRDDGDVQWLNEEEIAQLHKEYSSEDSVIFIPDVGRYCAGKYGLDVTVINQIARIHDDIDKGKDFERAYLVSLADEDTSWDQNGRYSEESEYYRTFTHWIAIKQISKDGKIYYEVMDSLGDQDYNDRKFKKLMHKKRGFRKLKKKESEQLKDLIKQIEFSKAFRDGFYALCSNPKGSEGDFVVINQLPNLLIDQILNASDQLLKQTKGEPFYNCMGLKQPLKIVKDALDALKKRQLISLRYYLSDAGTDISIVFTEEQEKMIEELEHKIVKYKSELLKQLKSNNIS